MELDDVITLATPEGIELELNLAGAGSRAIAGAIDLVVKLVLITAIFVALELAGGFGLAFAGAGAFLVFFAYDILFEVLGAGRTPGKLLCSLAVTRTDGAPVDLRASAVRNIARLIDGPTLSYVPSVIGILATRHNQRPGDLAADTVVIRRPRRSGHAAGASAPPGGRAPAPADWDVSAIGPEELAVVRRFLERRHALGPDARAALALRLAEGLRPRVGGAAAEQSPERFLETLLSTKAARGGRLVRPPAGR